MVVWYPLCLRTAAGVTCGQVSTRRAKRWRVKVRIKKAPTEREIDGVSLRGMLPGAVRDVSPSLGTWLIAEEYADSEMRQSSDIDDQREGFFNLDRHHRERRGQKR
jgi:hypothetical protein